MQQTFDRSIQQVAAVAVTIPLPSAPTAVGRIWCLFEIMTAISLNKEIIVYCNAASDDVEKGSLPKIDCNLASATVESDKEMILGLIDKRVKGGVKEVNRRVQQVLKGGLVQAEVTRALAISEREREAEARERQEKYSGENPYKNFKGKKRAMMRGFRDEN